MASAEADPNEEHTASYVPNVKIEPPHNLDEPGRLKITNVFTVTAVPDEEFPEQVKCMYSKLLKKEQIPDTNSIDGAAQDTFSENRNSLTKQCVQTSNEGLPYNQLNFPTPPSVPITKQKTKPAKKEMHVKTRNKPEFPPPYRNKKQMCESTSKQDIMACDICSTVFFSVESLEEHVVEMHVVDKEFKCTECTKLFISQEELDSHLEKHEKKDEKPGGHKCPICARVFATRNYVAGHLKSHEKSFACDLCSKRYPRKLDLERHQMNRHGKEKTFKCHKCPKSFCRDYTLQDHIRTHSQEKTIVCEYCDGRFQTKRQATNHRSSCKGTSKRITAENQRKELNFQFQKTKFKCSVCNQGCESRRNLKEHTLTHTRTHDRNLECKLCKTFYKLQMHLSKHQKKVHPQSLNGL